jgi:F-type H+-transporting ATPase subunit delta
MAEESTLARPYANAVFRFAQEKADLEGWSRKLALLAGVASEPRVAAALARPTLTDQARAQVLIDLTGDDLDDRARHLVRLMARNDRLDLLPAVAEAYEVLRADAEMVLDVEISTPFPLEDDQRDRIAERLRARFGREIQMETRHDPELIGGFFVRAGDTVIDASVRGRLARLQEQLLAQ